MRTAELIAKDIVRRPARSLSIVATVGLAVAVVASIQTLNSALRDRAKEQLLRFGANIMVHPTGMPVDVSSPGPGGQVTLPEVYRQAIESIPHHNMLVAVSPKLYERVPVGSRDMLVVGITDHELKAKPWWMANKQALTTGFPQGREALLGHHAASQLGGEIGHIELLGETLRVSAVLDETGAADDFAIFVPLELLQRLAKKRGMVHVIEVTTSCIACKAMNIYDMAQEIREALPGDAQSKILRQVAETQMGTLRRITQYALVGSVAMLAFCVFLLVNLTLGSIRDCKRELGMLLAMGMGERRMALVYGGKSLALSAVGGLVGCIMTVALCSLAGSIVLGADVTAAPALLAACFGLALGLGAVCSLVAVERIAGLDPVLVFREE